MKVVIVNTKQSGGGAAIATRRLFNALRTQGVEVTFVVAEGEGGQGVVVLSNSITGKIRYKINFLWERLVIWLSNRLSKKNLFTVSIANSGVDITKLPQVAEADIVHLHWINQGMMSLKNISTLVAMGKPVVITPHDMWYTTSICHHAGSCNNFKTECKNCPLLVAPGSDDLSAKVWHSKKELYKQNVTFITISKWISQRLKASALTATSSQVTIPNIIETEIFIPRNREHERTRLGVLPNERLIIFGAAKLNDPIKGADMLFSAIERSGMKESIVLLLFGSIKDDNEFLSRIPCRYIYKGRVTDKEQQAKLYSAADIAAVPSHYETFSLVIAEAMACGTPALAFDSAGQTSLIDHKRDGYLAKYPNIDDLAEGIVWLSQNVTKEMRTKASEKIVKTMSPQVVAQQHISLYKTLLTK